MLGDLLCRSRAEINHRPIQSTVYLKRTTSRSVCRIWATKFLFCPIMLKTRLLLANSSTFRTIKSDCRSKSSRRSFIDSAVKCLMLANSSKALATLRRINNSCCRLSQSKSSLSSKWCRISIRRSKLRIEMCDEWQQLNTYRSLKLKLSIQCNGSRIRTETLLNNCIIARLQ